MKIILPVLFSCFVMCRTSAQNSFTVSTPIIFSGVKVKDNWTPYSSPVYKEFLTGSALGYGLQVNYSFKAFFLGLGKGFNTDVGLGYFRQRFDMVRPFNYTSPVQIIYYTDHYSYECVDLSAGLTYKKILSEKYFLKLGVKYNWLKSFQQNYKPTSNFISQSNSRSIDFGSLIILSVKVNRRLSDKFSLGFATLAPIYTAWRNDKIFNDDPSTFNHPKFSLGFDFSISYLFKKTNL